MVVVGANAAGMSAASQAKRLRGDELEVVAFERGSHSSYSACGIPYWVAGDVADGENGLVARSPEDHRAKGIDLRTLTNVEAIDVQAGNVTVRELDSGRRYHEGFDHLVLATGAVPVRPSVPGGDAGGVFGVQTLDDGAALVVGLERLRPRHAVVIGGGYIGVEMAEALTRQQRDYEASWVKDQLKSAWQGADVEMLCDVRRARVVRRGGDNMSIVSHSGVRFIEAVGDADARLNDMMATFVGRVLAAQRANASGTPESEGTLALAQLGGARRARSRGWLSFRLTNGAWRRELATSSKQPADGFTVAAYEDEDELALLCQTYETADAEGRRLVRLLAELSARNALT